MELLKELSPAEYQQEAKPDCGGLILTLLDDEKEKIEQLVRQHNAVNSKDGADITFNYLETWNKFPRRVKRKLLEFKFKGGDHSYLLIKNLPLLQGLRDTPLAKNEIKGKQRDYAALLQSIISVSLGYVYNFKDKITTGLVDDIYPIKKDSNKQVGTNSVFLEWHVEDGFHETKADFVTLLCLRDDPEVKTYLMPANHLSLSDAERAQLSQLDYLIWEDLTFNNEGDLRSTKVKVLDGTEDPEIIYDPAYMEACSSASAEAFSSLKDSIVKGCLTLTLAEGEMLVFDNRRVVHSRNAYSPRFDGKDRWLLRTLVVESWWKAKNKKVESTLYVS
ncbi:TauD/TfdA family dioxygenase [Pseudoalteromonas piscicida]|uniref:TauD/TfdA family dioxygenase n=1 Tax=Pseudoalteromonas piscicida TaxID=43662 RepID=UPI0005FA53F1|nr:TauD/TfdA family dioxygenase [Pseudoalteromonas piscicida]KJZ03808.1 clavaminate synthase [Pseudoalteromonas piscicida]